MGIWGINRANLRRDAKLPAPEAASKTLSRSAMQERLLLFQTGRALESPLRFLAWSERKGYADTRAEETWSYGESADALKRVKELLRQSPLSALEAQGTCLPKRAMDLVRPMRDPTEIA